MLPLPLIDGAFFASASFLEAYMRCPLEAYNYKVLGRISAKARNALVFGNHKHSALEMHYRLQEFNLPQSEISSRISIMLADEFARKPVEPDDFRQLNWALELYHQYLKAHEFDALKPMHYKEPRPCKQCKGKATQCAWCNGTGQMTTMVEVPFALPLFEYRSTSQLSSLAPIPVYYHGFIDLPCTSDNMNFVLDFKTTSMLGQGFWDDKRASAQQVGYCWAFNQLTNIKLHGFLVRAIRTTQMPPGIASGKPNKKGEVKSIENWWAEGFPEERFYLGSDEIAEWHNNTIELMMQFFWHYERGFFPQHKPVGCVTKYGKCQYYDTCMTFPANERASLLSSGLFIDKQPSFEQERL